MTANLKVVEPFPVRCIDDSETTFPLTKGKGYMVSAISEHENLYQLRGDDQLVHLYGAIRFVKIPLCKKCGGVIGLNFHEEFNRKLMELQMCHDCEFWLQFKQDHDANPRQVFVADGVGFSVSPDGSTDIIGQKGFGGARFYFRFNDGYLLTSDNVHDRGDVDLAWQKDLPNDAVQISAEDYYADLQAQAHGMD